MGPMHPLLKDEHRLAPRLAKNPDEIDVRVLWYFPETYKIGMSGLGYQLVWWLLEQDTKLDVRRGFTDLEEPGDGLHDRRDLIGFTVSWELDFVNIIKLLNKNGVSPLSKDRIADQDLPLIFGGGPVLTANPEPFAEFFDVILLGDAETSVPSLIEAYRNSGFRSDGSSTDKQELLFKLSQVPGLYVPSQYKPVYAPGGAIEAINPIREGVPPAVRKQNFAPPPEYATHTQILSSATTWSDRFLIEVVRSCPQECRFCLASYLTRPFRATSVDTLMDKIDLALAHTNKIGLLGPSVTEHPQFEELALRLQANPDIDLSIASVRADTLTETVLATLKKLGQRSVTIAIESGSEKLRQIMKKNLTEEEIFQAVKLIDESGLSGVKFYGIVGLPFETQDDLNQTVDLITRLKKKHKRLRYVFGVSSFVPKAQTPYQWYGRDKDCAKKLEFIRKNLEKIGVEVRPESHNWSDIQALLSRADRRITPSLIEIAPQGEKLGAWKKALRRLPDDVPGLDYYAFRTIPQDEVLPWQHLFDTGKTAYLVRHLNEAKSLSNSKNLSNSNI